MIYEPINNKGVYGVSVQKIKSILSDIKVTSKNSNQSLWYETWLWMAILTLKKKSTKTVPYNFFD